MVFLCSGSGCLWCLKSATLVAVCGSNGLSHGLVSVDDLSVRLQSFMIDLAGLMTSFSKFLRPTPVDWARDNENMDWAARSLGPASWHTGEHELSVDRSYHVSQVLVPGPADREFAGKFSNPAPPPAQGKCHSCRRWIGIGSVHLQEPATSYPIVNPSLSTSVCPR